MPLCLLANDGRQRGARFEYCSRQIPVKISTTYYCRRCNIKMANGVGGDFSSFEKDPKELAEELAGRNKNRAPRLPGDDPDAAEIGQPPKRRLKALTAGELLT